MPVTIKDLAKIAGVSHTTISRALHGNPAISPATVIRVKEIADQMGYVPNASARGLKTRRTLTLGVIVSNVDDPFWGEVMHGVDEILHPAGYSFFVAATHRDRQREKEIVQLMMQRGVDGIILLAPQFSSDHISLLRAYGLPMAIVNNEGAEEYECLIYNDDIYGIDLITRYLIELGHQKIAYLGNKQGGRTNSERERGFMQQMDRSGLLVRSEYIHHVNGSIPDEGRSGGRHFLGLEERPTAIVCYNDYLAVGVYKAVLEAGLLIPRDISITGFDNITISDYLNPPLTTLHQFKYDLGVGAARMMLLMLEKQQGKSKVAIIPQKVCLKGELIIRQSTAPKIEGAGDQRTLLKSRKNP